AHRDALQLLGDAVVEVARQVVNRLLAQLLEAVEVVVAVGVELIDAQEAIDGRLVGEGETVPVDDGVALHEQAERLQVGEGRLLEEGASRRRLFGGAVDRHGERSRTLVCPPWVAGPPPAVNANGSESATATEAEGGDEEADG